MLLLYVELFYLILTNTTGDVFLLVCLLFPGVHYEFRLIPPEQDVATIFCALTCLSLSGIFLSFSELKVQRTCGGVTVYRTDLAFEFLRLYADAWDAIDKLTCYKWE
ncbi:hypothetical protein LENED_002748 [Lentinula edodes]|uniref:Uncharacterized protein n=1 Tax=Lentinula edodes TaxID=5353 RepID=A0A1Q3E1Q1_LENED|nr:hypothetical protein LENED_002748 [Lentinula edodes]